MLGKTDTKKELRELAKRVNILEDIRLSITKTEASTIYGRSVLGHMFALRETTHTLKTLRQPLGCWTPSEFFQRLDIRDKVQSDFILRTDFINHRNDRIIAIGSLSHWLGEVKKHLTFGGSYEFIERTRIDLLSSTISRMLQHERWCFFDSRYTTIFESALAVDLLHLSHIQEIINKEDDITNVLVWGMDRLRVINERFRNLTNECTEKKSASFTNLSSDIAEQITAIEGQFMRGLKH